jgi:predicted ribosome quality control (RQC) complex YloA/Tae2 family protein
VDTLAQQLHEQNGDKDANHIKALAREIEKMSERNAELDRILKRLYEDSVKEKISDDMFSKLLAEYEKEQSELQQKINETEQEIEETKANQKDAGSWIGLIQNYTKIKKLDRAVLGELVDKITIGEAKEVGGQKVIDITIYYRFVGAVS